MEKGKRKKEKGKRKRKRKSLGESHIIRTGVKEREKKECERMKTPSIFLHSQGRRMSDVLEEFCRRHPPAQAFFFVKECANLYGEDLDAESRCEFHGQFIYKYMLRLPHRERRPIEVYVFRDLTSGKKQRNTIGTVGGDYYSTDRWWDLSSAGGDGYSYNFRYVAKHCSNEIVRHRNPCTSEIVRGESNSRVRSLQAMSMWRLSTKELGAIGSRLCFLPA